MDNTQNLPKADSLFTTYSQNGNKVIPKAELIEAESQILKCQYQKAGSIGNFLFSQNRYEEAIQVYQKIIEREQDSNYEIEGLGCSELAISRYEWFVYEWYEKQKKQGLLQENPYDALGLCFVSLKLKGEKKQLASSVVWYEDMLGLRTDYRLILGYANILYMLDRFDEAIRQYKKVIQMRPTFINAYTSLALLYEYKRIEKPKSISLAKKILELTPFNMYAEYILGRNEKKVDQKIQYLIKASQRHPQYIRIVNEIGISYGSSKKIYKEAISWYMKCIQKVPQYTACYNNIGVNHQLLKNYPQALKWYFKCCEMDNEYRSAYDNLIDVFDSLKYTDEQIIEEYQKHPLIDRFKFYLNLGTSFNRKTRYNDSLKWLQLAKQLNSTNVTVFNTFGMNYDDLKKYQQSQQNYLKCIQLDPTFYQAYYNLAIACKNRDNIEKAIHYYEKSVQVNPKYSYAYNNLGNIYKAQQNYQKALFYYRQAVEHLSTYTLAFVNMAVCHEKLQNYTEAHRYFKRAKEVLPTDNNNLSESNKTFINDSISRFQKQGKEWRQSGKLSKTQKQKLDQFIQRYQKKVGEFYMGRNLSAVSNQIALRTQILDIVKLISEDKFSLELIDKIFQNVKKAFFKNEQYFQIIPQILIQYFYKQKFDQNKNIIQIERNLKKIMKNLSNFQKNEEIIRAESILNFKFKNFNPSEVAEINLFKENTIFDSYDSLYTQITRVNQNASKVIIDFKELVSAISKRSNAIHYGVNMKIPNIHDDQQFLTVLKILKNMFKKEISQQKEEQIISKIDKVLTSKAEVNLKTVTQQIKDIWSKQISQILKKRMQNNTQTKFVVGDLVKCKINTINHQKMLKTLQTCNNLCSIKGYEIISMNRQQRSHLAFKIILKIKIRQTICELTIALNQDDNRQRFFEDIDQIQQNPLGVIFGSYLYLTNKFSYPFYSNCKDIERYFQQNGTQSDKSLKQSSSYIIKQFQRAEKFGQFLK